MRRFARILVIAAAACGWGTPAMADATVFLGASTTPSSRAAKGFAIGAGFVIVGFEFEYSDTSEDAEEAAPGVRTAMGNVLLQTPTIARMQFYYTVGAGGYRERLVGEGETHYGANTGGGVKLSLIGPLRARFDYRLFNLRGDPLHSRVHRIYAGANVNF
jgi:hypothetical protein